MQSDRLAAYSHPAPAWLIEPYLPSEGIVFLYGKKGVGKSPLTWAMAQAVATGESDLFTVRSTGQVLYVEVDSPLPTVKLRAPKVLSSPNAWYCFPRDPLICLPLCCSIRRLLLRNLSPQNPVPFPTFLLPLNTGDARPIAEISHVSPDSGADESCG